MILNILIVIGIGIFIAYDICDYYDYKYRNIMSSRTFPKRPNVIIRISNLLRESSSYQYYKEKGVIKT